MRHILILIILTESLLSCSKPRPNCNQYGNTRTRLVAFKVAKHSKMWLEDINTKQVFEFGSMGGRRIPDLNLGDTLTVKYCMDTQEILFIAADHAIRPENTESRFESLPGYEKLQ